MFISILKHKLYSRNLSIRQAAREIGISHTTLQRTLSGNTLDLETLLKISRFLDIRPELTLNSMDEATLIDQVVLLFLQSEPELLQKLYFAISQIKSNCLEISDLKEILEFITFKLRQRRVDDNSDVIAPLSSDM